jgi:hypothetical protein
MTFKNILFEYKNELNIDIEALRDIFRIYFD